VFNNQEHHKQLTDSSIQLDLYRAQQLFKTAIPSNISMLAGTALVSSYFYDAANTAITLWIIAMCFMAGARIITSRRFLHSQKINFTNITVKTWLNIYLVSAFMFGSTSASLVLFMPENMSPIDTSILYLALFSTIVGSIATLSASITTYLAFSSPIFLAAFFYYFINPTQMTLFASIASVIYFSFTTFSARLLNKRYLQNASLIIENEFLIDKLHDEIIQKELARQKIIDDQHTLEETIELRTKELADINEILVDEINKRRRIEHNLKHLAHHDVLTNLPNRLLLDARLNHAIERAKRENLQVAVMFIDLDHFKTVNDSLGHEVGDKLLMSVSNRLTNCIREDDTVARLGGDEFVIIIEQVHDIGNLDPLLKKIMSVTSDTISISEHDISISASIGISIYPDDGKSPEQLMRNADSAMYYVKDNGRRKYHFYTKELTTTAYNRVILETDLKRAIEHGQMTVYYQPQISLTSKEITGVEALVRWQHPELGLLPPKQFLFVAEQAGLLNDIGEMVLNIACKQMVKWKQMGIPIGTVAVNVSGSQIHQTDLVNIVSETLQQTGCNKEWLELEITEDFIIKKSRQAITTLQQLRDLGISLAIDDFGTGYSSLSYLKQLPINKLKIDRSFVKDINNDMEDASLVQAIIAMGKSLNLKLIAEGVENGSHEIFLSAHGCEYAQGYYYSKPVSADEIEKLFSIESEEGSYKLLGRMN